MRWSIFVHGKEFTFHAGSKEAKCFYFGLYKIKNDIMSAGSPPVVPRLIRGCGFMINHRMFYITRTISGAVIVGHIAD